MPPPIYYECCRYTDLETVKAALESKWADHSSHEGYGTLFDEEFTVTYAAGDPDLLMVSGDHTCIVFGGERYPGQDPLRAAYYTDLLPELELLFPALNGVLPEMEHDHFLAEQVSEFCNHVP